MHGDRGLTAAAINNYNDKAAKFHPNAKLRHRWVVHSVLSDQSRKGYKASVRVSKIVSLVAIDGLLAPQPLRVGFDHSECVLRH